MSSISDFLIEFDLFQTDLSQCLNACSPQQVQEVAQSLLWMRQQSSNTLYREDSITEARKCFRDACTWVEGRIQSGECLSEAGLKEIYLRICGREFSLRQDRVFSGLDEYPSPAEVLTSWPSLVEKLEKQIANREEALTHAADLYQSVISLHPFEDANGRIGRLCADWVLIGFGLLPVVFHGPADGQVRLIEGKISRSLDTAVQAIMQGQRNAMKALNHSLSKTTRLGQRFTFDQVLLPSNDLLFSR